MATLSLRIITPERIVLEKEVEQVSARAVDGELAILPNHEPLVTALAIDVLRFKTKGDEETAAVIGGLMDVSEVNKGDAMHTVVTVISDVAELGAEIDATRAEQAKAKAEAEKSQKSDKLDVYVAEMAMSRAIARLKAAELAKSRRRGRPEIS